MDVLPSTSKNRYMRTYNEFHNWITSKGTTSFSQRVLMAYFSELAEKKKPSTLWSYYSMLKATIRSNNDIDIGTYTQLTAFLKSKASGYRPKKTKVFTKAEVERFINDAADETWLDVKVACIFGVSGACRTHELPDIKVEDVERHNDLLLVTIPKTETKVKRSFTITASFFNVVQKYSAMQPVHTQGNRFFLNFQRGKCTVQPIGKNKFYHIPQRIATYLKLPKPECYTGHSFRRTSATILVNSGATTETIKRHGAWSSAKVADQYIEDSLHYKKKTGNVITSLINRTSTTVSATSVLAEPIFDFDTSKEEPSDIQPPVEHSSENLSADEPQVTTTITQSEVLSQTKIQSEVSTQMVAQTYKQELNKMFHFTNCPHLTINFNSK